MPTRARHCRRWECCPEMIEQCIGEASGATTQWRRSRPHGARPRPSACLAPALFGQMALNELAPALFGRVAFNEPKWRRHVLSMRPWRSNRNSEIA